MAGLTGLHRTTLVTMINAQFSARKHLFRTVLRANCSVITSSKMMSHQSTSIKPSYDAVIVGAGHNGLVAASYLQRAGLKVCVLERREVIGGAAVTEEIVPGFKFSRASYVLSLLRPRVMNELELRKHGLVTIRRDPNSYTPIIDDGVGSKSVASSSLTLGRSSADNAAQIAKFSSRDAEAYVRYNNQLQRIVTALDSLLDAPPVDRSKFRIARAWQNRDALKALISTGVRLGKDVFALYEFLTSPASKLLDRWFEADVLKATLSTDSVVGAMISPFQHGSGYVLLHHVMGELEGEKGVWAYVKGGMGAVSDAIASSAKSFGAEIFTKQEVSQILVDSNRVTSGVVLKDGTHIRSKIVLSNTTAKVTFIDLVDRNLVPDEFLSAVKSIDYTSPVTKINVAVSRLPNFRTDPNANANRPMPHHHASIHLNCHSMDMIHQAYVDATSGRKKYSTRPLIEMTIPSSLDDTLAPAGSHVVQLFTQYTPYSFSDGTKWTEELKNAYADTVFDSIERYAPGFKESVIGRDVLTPPDIERIFGLTGGNIFHGAMSLDQLYFCRPSFNYSDYRSPIAGLYMCGSGAHPGGGVMGSAGRLAALTALKTFGGK